MKIVLAAVSILLLSGAAAFAEDKAKSTTDAPAASGKPDATGGAGDKMSPGTTGAMDKSSSGVATTPDEVKKQGGAATAPNKMQGNDGVKAGEEKK